jgi:hypothetical protein
MSGLIPDSNYTITKRLSVGYLGTPLTFDLASVKGVLIHFEGATPMGSIAGTKTVTGSADAVITSNGKDIVLEGQWPRKTTICNLKTPTANGSDKILTGNFASDANWAKGTGWTINATAIHATGNATTLQETSTTVVNGETYLLTYTIASTTTAGVLTPSAGGVTLTARTKAIGDATATYSEEFLALSTAKVTFTSDALWAGTIDDVKMYKVTPANISIVAWC